MSTSLFNSIRYNSSCFNSEVDVYGGPVEPVVCHGALTQQEKMANVTTELFGDPLVCALEDDARKVIVLASPPKALKSRLLMKVITFFVS